jgi:hypothetical protein
LLVVGFMERSALYNRLIGSTPIGWSTSRPARRRWSNERASSTASVAAER